MRSHLVPSELFTAPEPGGARTSLSAELLRSLSSAAGVDARAPAPRKSAQNRLFLSILVSLASLAATVSSGEGWRSPSAIAVSPTRSAVYVAAAESRELLVLEGTEDAKPQVWQLPDSPTGMAVAPDGRLIFVTAGGPTGRVLALDAAKGSIRDRWKAGHTPVSPVLTRDGQRLYLCNRFDQTVAAYDTRSGKMLSCVTVAREPIVAAFGPDERFLFVGHHLPSQPSTAPEVFTCVSVLDTTENRVVAEIPLPNGSTAIRGIAVSPDRAFVYVTHSLARYHLPTTQLERGWMNTSALTVIDAVQRQRLNTVLLDDVDRGAPNPWGIASTADGRWLVIAHAGTHELSIIDQPALLAKLRRLAAGERVSEVSGLPEDAPNDLTFLVDLRRRIPLAGHGPRALAITGTWAAAAAYYSDTVEWVDLTATNRPVPRSVSLGPVRPPDTVRRGEMLFHDAALCFQHWQSCASCHPDTRVDGLNWDLLNDGIGNPKNTRSMLLTHQTPPAMSLGVRETAESAVRAGIRHIQFVVRPESDAVAIDEYLKTLKPIPSPSLEDGKLGPTARRGKEVFGRAGCASCHPGPLYTDLKPYDVGSGTGREQGATFDTPSLIECWRTGPYLHDGSAPTLEALFRQLNPENKHGETSNLSDADLKALIRYVLSL